MPDKEKNITGKVAQKHKFRLYITGASTNSFRAVNNITALLKQQLEGMHELNIIDVHQTPSVAKLVDIIALPLLVRTFPPPEKRWIGDLSNEEKIMETLIVRQIYEQNDK